MSPRLRRLALVLLALSAAFALSACSKKSNPVDGLIPPLTQDDADDMVQQVALTIATDHGGWLTDALSTFASIPQTAPGPLRRLSAAFAAPASAQRAFRVNTRDTTVNVAAMSYLFHYFYTDTSGVDSLEAWAPGVNVVDGTCLATGTIDVTNAFLGSFHHVGDPITGEGFVTSDSVRFSGATDDSLYGSMTPAIRGGSARTFAVVFFVDYDFYLHRNDPPSAFPFSGSSEILVFSDRLKTDLSGVDHGTDGLVTITFDGTQTPLVGITNDTDSLTPQFRYRIDLKTGTITRVTTTL